MHCGCRLWEHIDKFQATDLPRSFHPRVLLKLVHLHKEVVVAVVEVGVEHLLVDSGVGPRQLLVVPVRGERQVVVAGVEDVVQGHRLPVPIHRDPLVLGGHHVSQALLWKSQSDQENDSSDEIHERERSVSVSLTAGLRGNGFVGSQTGLNHKHQSLHWRISCTGLLNKAPRLSISAVIRILSSCHQIGRRQCFQKLSLQLDNRSEPFGYLVKTYFRPLGNVTCCYATGLSTSPISFSWCLIWTLTFSISSFTNLQIPSICQKSVWNSTCCKLVSVARLCWWTRLLVLPAGPLVVFRRASHSWANQQTSFSRRWNPYIPTRAGHAEFFHKPICVSLYEHIIWQTEKNAYCMQLCLYPQ